MSVQVNICLDKFPIQNGLKEGDASFPLLFNSAVQHAIKKAQENQMGLNLNGTYQLLVYADDVNLLEHNIKTIRKTQKHSLMLVSAKVYKSTQKSTVIRMQGKKIKNKIKIANRSSGKAAKSDN
jgi:hypothetical protein